MMFKRGLTAVLFLALAHVGLLVGCGDDSGGTDAGIDAAVFCLANQRVEDGSCVACPPGTTNPPGDNSLGGDTTCEARLCEEDQRVQANACTACPADTFNEAGDDASQTDTTCEDACQVALDLSCAAFEEAYVKASTVDEADRFGRSVALDGDTLVVGAPDEDADTGINGTQSDDSAVDSGAVYVFTREGATWTQQAYLKASNVGANDRFGFTVALSGDTLAVGASGEDSATAGINGDENDNSLESTGAVYVFTRSGSSWSQQAYLKASNPDSTDSFGVALALSGDTLAVGANWEDGSTTGVNGDETDDMALQSGAVYVFTRASNTWSQQAYLKASNTGAGDEFGSALALDGDTLAVGAWEEDSAAIGINGTESSDASGTSGAVYVFTRSGVTWTQQAYVKASDTTPDAQFGWSVAISGETLAVGAPERGGGAVYIFARAGGVWTQQAVRTANRADANGAFGYSLSLSASTLVVGARTESRPGFGLNADEPFGTIEASGAVYAFARNETSWTQIAYFKASNPDPFDQFGFSVSISGNTIAVGATNEDSDATGLNGSEASNDALDSGAAYVRRIAP